MSAAISLGAFSASAAAAYVQTPAAAGAPGTLAAAGGAAFTALWRLRTYFFSFPFSHTDNE